MHTLLVFNPVSGKKESRAERLGRIIFSLSEQGEVTVYQTKKKGDAEDYLRDLNNSIYDRIVCCGGDGTLHEVISGMIQSGIKVPVGYIPMGSTNDCANNLGVTLNTAVKCIKEGTPGAIDIGCVNGKYFTYVAAFGAFTNVPFTTPQELKNNLGHFAYLLEGIKQLGEITPKRILFRADDGEWIEDDVVLGIITNSFSVAGMKNFKPDEVLLNDGKFEYLFVKFPNNLLELQAAITSLLNGKIDERYIHYGQFSNIEIRSSALEWTLDGESGGIFDKTTIQVHPDAVQILQKD